MDLSYTQTVCITQKQKGTNCLRSLQRRVYKKSSIAILLHTIVDSSWEILDPKLRSEWKNWKLNMIREQEGNSARKAQFGYELILVP